MKRNKKSKNSSQETWKNHRKPKVEVQKQTCAEAERKGKNTNTTRKTANTQNSDYIIQIESENSNGERQDLIETNLSPKEKDSIPQITQILEKHAKNAFLFALSFVNLPAVS